MNREDVALLVVLSGLHRPFLTYVKTVFPGRCPICFLKRPRHSQDCHVARMQNLKETANLLRVVAMIEREYTL